MPPSERDKARIASINEKVRRQEQSFGPLFQRMDADWMLYQLKPFVPRPGDGIRREEAYTSNRPKVVADKLVGSIAAAKQIIRTETDADNEEQRDQDSNFERFGIGALKLANKMRENAGGVPVTTELAFRAITQGGYVAARALLIKDEKGDTLVDVTPIHPRHLLIQFGKREPIWAAIVTSRDRASIRDEYPDFKFDYEDQRDKGEDDQQVERVVDYYWKEDGKYMNAVVVDGQWALEPHDTFATRFPIVARAVGAHSGASGQMSLSENTGTSNQMPGIRDFAESAFASIRGLTEFKNLLYSFRMVMARKSVRGVNKVFSSGGTRELDDDIDENVTEINLDTDNNEDIVPLEVRELTRDIDSLSGMVAVEEADATLPEQSFGRLPAPISGNALRILGAAEGQRLEPFLRPIESCIEGVIEALASQYETGRYKPIRVSGKTRDRRGFSREITPRDIRNHDAISVRLVPELPQDVQEKWLTAQLATQPGANGMPLASHFTAWEEILELQDSDIESERVFAQMSRSSSEKALLMTQLVAAQRSGEEETVQFLERDLKRILDQEAMEEMARRIAFLTMLFQNPIGAAVASGQAGGQGGQQQAGSPFAGISPEMMGLSGVVPGSINPSPEAGANTTAPREAAANAIGITLANPAQVQQFG